mgnify:FL=1
MKANGRLKIDVLIIFKNFKLNRGLLLNIDIIVKTSFELSHGM